MSQSWRVQNIVVIGRVCSKLERSEFSSNFEFDRNMFSGTGARYLYEKADYESMKKLVKCNCATMFDKLNTKKNGKFSATSLKNQSKHTFPRKNVNQVDHTDQNGWTNKSWKWYRINPERIKSGEAWKPTHLMKPAHGLETKHDGQFARLWKHIRKILHRKYKG